MIIMIIIILIIIIIIIIIITMARIIFQPTISEELFFLRSTQYMVASFCLHASIMSGAPVCLSQFCRQIRLSCSRQNQRPNSELQAGRGRRGLRLIQVHGSYAANFDNVLGNRMGKQDLGAIASALCDFPMSPQVSIGWIVCWLVGWSVCYYFRKKGGKLQSPIAPIGALVYYCIIPMLVRALFPNFTATATPTASALLTYLGFGAWRNLKFSHK